MPVTTRHLRRGTMTVHWVTGIATIAAPTTTEINAGDEITQLLTTIEGFLVDSLPVALKTVDNYGQLLTVEGDRLVVEVPTLGFYDTGAGESGPEGSDPLRSTLAQGTQGYVVFCLEGDPTIGDRAEIWPVVAMGLRTRISGGNEPAMVAASFAMWDQPEEDATIA